MKRFTVSVFIAIIAFTTGLECKAKTISKCDTKKVNTYFSKVLNGENAEYKGNNRQ